MCDNNPAAATRSNNVVGVFVGGSLAACGTTSKINTRGRYVTLRGDGILF